MNRWKTLVLVLAGYAFAFAASIATVAIYDLRFSPADNQAMGGMIAGGEMILGGGVFLFLALVPTGYLLWSLRDSAGFWSAFSIAGFAFALSGGLAAIVSPFLAGPAMANRTPMFLQLFGLAQVLGSPVWIGAFLVFAALAPGRMLRRRMLAAAAIETVIAACGILRFLVSAARI